MTFLISALPAIVSVIQTFAPGLMAGLPAIIPQLLTNAPKILEAVQIAEQLFAQSGKHDDALHSLLVGLAGIEPKLKELPLLKEPILDQIKKNADAAINLQQSDG